MEFKVLEGNAQYIEKALNRFNKDGFEIKIKGVSSTDRDIQLGVGGIVVIFTVEKPIKLDIKNIKIPVKKETKQKGKK